MRYLTVLISLVLLVGCTTTPIQQQFERIEGPTARSHNSLVMDRAICISEHNNQVAIFSDCMKFRGWKMLDPVAVSSEIDSYDPGIQ